MNLCVCLACPFTQSILDVTHHQMLIPLYHSLPEPSATSSHGVRCLASEHAVIVKEQTAQAIANTARAYERSGVEAALSEVTVMQKPTLRRGGLAAMTATFSHFYYCVSAAFNRSLSLSPVLSLLFLSILLPQLQEAEPEKPPPPETNLAEQSEQPPKAKDAESAAQPNSEASEVEIPSVGRILVRSDADGYDEEVHR